MTDKKRAEELQRLVDAYLRDLNDLHRLAAEFMRIVHGMDHYRRVAATLKS